MSEDNCCFKHTVENLNIIIHDGINDIEEAGLCCLDTNMEHLLKICYIKLQEAAHYLSLLSEKL